MMNKRKYEFEKYEFDNKKFRGIFEKILQNQYYIHNAICFLSEIDLNKKLIISREKKLFNCFKQSINNLDSEFLMSLKSLVKEVAKDEPWEKSYVNKGMGGILKFTDKRNKILDYIYRDFLIKKSGLETFAEFENICEHLRFSLSDLNCWILRNFSSNYERSYDEWWDIDYKNPEMDHLEYLGRVPIGRVREASDNFILYKPVLDGECIEWYQYFYKKLKKDSSFCYGVPPASFKLDS